MHKKVLNHAGEEINASIAKAIAVLDEARTNLLEVSNDIQHELGHTARVCIFDQHVYADIVNSLRRILEDAEMDNTSFSDVSPFGCYDLKEHPEFDPKNPTPYIKDRTEFWRKTWIIKPLQYALILLETARPWHEHEEKIIRKNLEKKSLSQDPDNQ